MYGQAATPAATLGAQSTVSVSNQASPTTLRTEASSPLDGDTVEPAPQRITQLQLVANNIPASTTALTVLGVTVVLFISFRHGLAWRKVLLRGETFLVRHPLLDTVAASVISSAVVLGHTAGLIR
jgi:hypothetical protein